MNGIYYGSTFQILILFNNFTRVQSLAKHPIGILKVKGCNTLANIAKIIQSTTLKDYYYIERSTKDEKINKGWNI